MSRYHSTVSKKKRLDVRRSYKENAEDALLIFLTIIAVGVFISIAYFFGVQK